MRIWHVLAVVAIAAMLAAGQAQVAWSQTTRPAEGTPTGGAREGGDESPPQDDQKAGKPGETTTKQDDRKGGGRGPIQWFIPAMIGVMVLLWFWMGRGRRKQQRRRKEMLETLKKGDKVTSIGGVIGTVVEIKGGEITVKVDESSNVRMKFARWAIRGVGETGKAENADEGSEKK